MKNRKNKLKWIGFGGFLLLSILISGCQSVTKVEFYDVTEQNCHFSVPNQDGKIGHGPVKSIEGKSGVADFSDNKTFKFSLSVLGL